MSETTAGTNQLWAGRQTGKVDDIMVEMGESIYLDIELYREDTYGSANHARMLEKIGILTGAELEAILSGLQKIRTEIEAGEMKLDPNLEDIHTHVESRLIELVGEAGKKLHTARSRNDQVALDTHLYVRDQSARLGALLGVLCETLKNRAAEQTETILPGYTHLQPAQPVRLSHHLLAHFWAFLRDAEKMYYTCEQADRLPLGSGAMAGVNYDTDREMLRDSMDFASIYPNSMDAVSSRDHILNFLYACSVFMTHASRLADEIILWNTVEFSFISLPDSLTTGSSIMPQKKNPDLAELIRGKAGRVNANLNNLLTNQKGLPFTYNRDFQEDRAPLLDSARQCRMAVVALEAMVREMTFKGENMKKSLEKGYVTATDLADALVSEKGVPFREAHHLVGALVARCAEKGYYLSSIPAPERAEVSAYFEEDEFFTAAVDLYKSADKKVSYGGAAGFRQSEQLELAERELERVRAWKLPDLAYQI